MTAEPYTLPMFPLGNVLFPHAMTSLHIFEPRYRALARDCTQGNREFGIVLIERGHEVGGGDVRFNVGTAARIVEALELDDGRWLLGALGVRRLRVQTWLSEDPYPLAIVEDLDDRDLDEADAPLVAAADRAVRRSLVHKAELDEPAPSATVTLDDEPSVLAMQLAAIAPIGPLDRQSLLEENDARTRVQRLIGLMEEENAVLAARLAGG